MARVVGWLIVVVGLLLVLLAVFGGEVGLLAVRFGRGHVIALVLGLICLGLGGYLALRPRRVMV